MECGTYASNHTACSVLRGDGSTSCAGLEGNAKGDAYGEGDGFGSGRAYGKGEGVGNGDRIGKIIKGKVAHVEIDAGSPSWYV